MNCNNQQVQSKFYYKHTKLAMPNCVVSLCLVCDLCGTNNPIESLFLYVEQLDVSK